jgi:CDP-6-deoxy-D-xylo-4-hexulose-3-dehydrase
MEKADMKINLPLMDNNITGDDLGILIDFLKRKPRLTQSGNVSAFEAEWSEWLGVDNSVYVNSGASANLITMTALKYLYGEGEIIVPALTWVSDISSVIMNGFTPVFTDINPRNLCMDDEQVISKITNKTRAVFITYVQGFNGLTDRLVAELEKRKIPLIEDVCEAHGATFKGRNLGTFGLAANFSFYFAHHMSTIEGGMVSVNDPELYEVLRMLRSHGMVREAVSDEVKSDYASKYSDLNPDFIFAYPGFNVRGTEIGGVLGRAQLKKLDSNNDERRDNLKFFLNNLNPDIYRVDFELEGSCSYAFPLVMRNKDFDFRSRLEKALSEASVEFRRGSSGGGNQLRQPYLRKLMPHGEYKKYPEVEHIHFFGYYIGNYPSLEKDKISALCELLNGLK